MGFEPTVRASVQRFSSLMTVVLMRPGRSDWGRSVRHFVATIPAHAVLSLIVTGGSFAKWFAETPFRPREFNPRVQSLAIPAFCHRYFEHLAFMTYHTIEVLIRPSYGTDYQAPRNRQTRNRGYPIIEKQVWWFTRRPHRWRLL